MRWGSVLAAATLTATAVVMSGASMSAERDDRDIGGASRATDHLVHVQRYGMGTMFDLFAYHASRETAQQAVDAAWAEIDRLDRVMSHFRDDSDLSRLNRDGARGFVTVDPSLHDILASSASLSLRTGGRFDVTMTPVLRVWQRAFDAGQPPSDADVAEAQACVGADRVETLAPDRVRFTTPCTAVELGGVGKGYAVDRALAVLASRGVRNALINAGGSSIGAIGAPPDSDGWPVRLGAPVTGHQVALLQDASMSTSTQHRRAFARGAGRFGAIVDPRAGAPVPSDASVTVIAANGTSAEALTKALLMTSPEEATAMLGAFPGVVALWISADGRLTSAWRESTLSLADAP